MKMYKKQNSVYKIEYIFIKTNKVSWTEWRYCKDSSHARNLGNYILRDKKLPLTQWKVKVKAIK
jgi:hypothetical protein